MSQGRKKNVVRPGLEPRVSRLPCEHSTTELPSHTIDRLHFPSALLDSSPNLLGTMPEPTRQSLSGCCSQPEHGPTLSQQMSQGRKKNVARPGLEPRVSRFPYEHSTTELPNVTGAEKERGPTGTRTQGLSLTLRALYH